MLRVPRRRDLRDRRDAWRRRRSRHEARLPRRRARLRRAARRACLRRRGRRPEPRAVTTGSATRASAWARTCRAWSRPITGEEEAAPAAGLRVRARPTRTWRAGATGGASPTSSSSSTFVLITFVTIVVISLLAYSTVYGASRTWPNNIDFIQTEGDVAQGARSGLVRLLLLARSARSRCSRRRWGSSTTPAASPPTCCKTSLLPADAWREQALLPALVWGLIVIGILDPAGRLRPAARARW